MSKSTMRKMMGRGQGRWKVGKKLQERVSQPKNSHVHHTIMLLKDCKN